VAKPRTPLIISGPTRNPPTNITRSTASFPKLTRGEEIKGKEPGESYTTGIITVDEKHCAAGGR